MSQLQRPLEFGRDLKLALRRHWTKAVSFAALVILVTLVCIKYVPRHFVSEARLFVNSGRNLDPQAAASSAGQTRENESDTLIAVLGSRTLLEQVVEGIDPDAILSGQLPKELPPVESIVQRHENNVEPTPKAGGTTRDERYEQAIRKLEHNISISAPKESGTIVIHGRAETPELAQRIVASLVALCLDEHLRVHHTPSSFEFFHEQSRQLQQQWDQASARLREAKDKYGVVSPDGKRRMLEDQLAEVETQLVRELYEHEADERRLSAQFAPDHPQLVAIRAAIAELTREIGKESEVGGQKTGVSDQTSEVNVEGSDQGNSHVTPDSRLRTTGSISTLRLRRDALRQELAALNEQEVLIAQFVREAELAETRFQAFTEKAEQARINAQLDQVQISKLSVVQPASYPNQATGPRPMYVLAVGIFVGLLGGLGVAVGCYYADPLLKTRKEVELELELTVTGPVPVSDAPLEAAV